MIALSMTLASLVLPQPAEAKVIVGGDDADTIFGSNSGDDIEGGAGFDRIYGRAPGRARATSPTTTANRAT